MSNCELAWGEGQTTYTVQLAGSSTTDSTISVFPTLAPNEVSLPRMGANTCARVMCNVQSVRALLDVRSRNLDETRVVLAST